jgi:hypothetical protein
MQLHHVNHEDAIIMRGALRARGRDRRHTQSSKIEGLPTRSKPLFAIDWLSRGILVERETSVLTDVDAVVALTRSRAPEVTMRHPGREPDSFRLTNASGLSFGVYLIRRKP